MKFKSVLRCFCAGLFVSVCAMANAVTTTSPVTYNINLSNNSDTLTGTITTDGRIGYLLASDFLSFTLTDTPKAGSGFSLSGSSLLSASPFVTCNILAFGLGCGFSVTNDGKALLFDNVATIDNNNAIFKSTTGSTFSFSDAFNGAWVFKDGSTSKSVTFAQSGNLLVGLVPEPQSYAMFLSGLGIMGLIARRRRKS